MSGCNIWFKIHSFNITFNSKLQPNLKGGKKCFTHSPALYATWITTCDVHWCHCISYLWLSRRIRVDASSLMFQKVEGNSCKSKTFLLLSATCFLLCHQMCSLILIVDSRLISWKKVEKTIYLFSQSSFN